MADKPEKTPEEIDAQLQKESREKSAARTKLVDNIINILHEEFKKGTSTESLLS